MMTVSFEATGDQDLWRFANSWIRSQRVLIWCIAAPFYHHMRCSAQDLESESLLTAYQVMVSLLASGKNMNSMTKYFRVVFKSRCIRMTFGVKLVDIELDQIQMDCEQNQREELDQAVIDQALQALTTRQREISCWILSQPTPVNMDSISQVFGIRKRTAQAIISNAIQRLEKLHGTNRVRNAIPTAS